MSELEVVCALTDCSISCEEVDVKIPGRDYHFHIDALVKIYLSSGKLSDPFTSTDFSDEIKARILERVSHHTRHAVFLDSPDSSLSLNGLEKIGEIILEILRRTGTVLDVTEFDVKINHQSLYLGNLESDLSSYLPSRDEQYIVECTKGVNPLHLQKMHAYVSKNGSPEIADAILRELTHGTTKNL